MPSVTTDKQSRRAKGEITATYNVGMLMLGSSFGIALVSITVASPGAACAHHVRDGEREGCQRRAQKGSGGLQKTCVPDAFQISAAKNRCEEKINPRPGPTFDCNGHLRASTRICQPFCGLQNACGRQNACALPIRSAAGSPRAHTAGAGRVRRIVHASNMHVVGL